MSRSILSSFSSALGRSYGHQQEAAYCSTATCSGGNRMRCSGLECHPQAAECWVSCPLTRSPCPAFTLTAELFIQGEESTWDPANFSMGLLAVLTVGCPLKRRRQSISPIWSESIFTQYICEMDITRYPHSYKCSQWLIDLWQSGQIMCFLNWYGISCFQGHWTAMCGSLNRTLADLLSALPRSDTSKKRLELFSKVGNFASCRH